MRELMKKEALKRMRALDLHENVLKDFKKGKLNKSIGCYGLLYHLTDMEKELIKRFEEDVDALAYHVILSETYLGRMLTIMYVSKYEEEWERDMSDLDVGYAFAFAVLSSAEDTDVNHTDYKRNGEIGSILFEKVNGGLRRVFV